MNQFRQNILKKLPQFSLDDFNYFLKESQKKVESLQLAKDCCIHTSYIGCIDAEYIRCKYCLLNCGFKCIGTTEGDYKRREDAKTESPIIKNRNHFKDKYPDTVVLMRVGDFYEAFADDADLIHSLLGLALTRRSGVKMAGLPYHSLDGYLKKLIQAGHKVAVCEQVEKPDSKVIKRDVVRLV